MDLDDWRRRPPHLARPEPRTARGRRPRRDGAASAAPGTASRRHQATRIASVSRAGTEGTGRGGLFVFFFGGCGASGGRGPSVVGCGMRTKPAVADSNAWDVFRGASGARPAKAELGACAARDGGSPPSDNPGALALGPAKLKPLARAIVVGRSSTRGRRRPRGRPLHGGGTHHEEPTL